MTLADLPGESRWIDALSIGQTDRYIATQTALMGDIHSKARSVAALLQKSDGDT